MTMKFNSKMTPTSGTEITLNGTTIGTLDLSACYTQLNKVTLINCTVNTLKRLGGNTTKPIIVSGTYSFDPEDYLQAGSTAKKVGDVWVVTVAE